MINASWGAGRNGGTGTRHPGRVPGVQAPPGAANLRPVIGKTLGGKEEKLVYASGGKGKTKTLRTPSHERRSFVLSDDEILQLARWACMIEQHYGTPMDMEWAKGGESGELYCVQARPETVHSRQRTQALKTHHLRETGDPLVTGVAIGQAIAAGRVKILHDPSEMRRFEQGDVLVTERTDPDWGPIMKRATAIVTDHAGRTSHAAIVSRELGIPAVVGTESGTKQLD